MAFSKSFTSCLGFTFPFNENGVNGWTCRLRDHIVQPKIPSEVAQLAHFEHHAKTTNNPFVLVVCCTVWFAFSGMCRDAHIQRSYLLKKCKHCWIFHCIAGKDRYKPFNWVLPDMTISGTIACVRSHQHANVCMCMRLRVRVRAYTFACVHVRVCVCMCTFACACVRLQC